MELALVIVWGISGILNLCCKEVSKFSYGLMWVMLMFCLIQDMLGVM